MPYQFGPKGLELWNIQSTNKSLKALEFNLLPFKKKWKGVPRPQTIGFNCHKKRNLKSNNIEKLRQKSKKDLQQT